MLICQRITCKGRWQISSLVFDCTAFLSERNREKKKMWGKSLPISLQKHEICCRDHHQCRRNVQKFWGGGRVSVQGVKSLGGHFARLCRGVEFYEVKKNFCHFFQKENGNTFTLLIIFIVKSLQKEQNSTNLLLQPLICQNKHAITPK